MNLKKQFSIKNIYFCFVIFFLFFAKMNHAEAFSIASSDIIDGGAIQTFSTNVTMKGQDEDNPLVLSYNYAKNYGGMISSHNDKTETIQLAVLDNVTIKHNKVQGGDNTPNIDDYYLGGAISLSGNGDKNINFTGINIKITNNETTGPLRDGNDYIKGGAIFIEYANIVNFSGNIDINYNKIGWTGDNPGYGTNEGGGFAYFSKCSNVSFSGYIKFIGNRNTLDDSDGGVIFFDADIPMNINITGDFDINNNYSPNYASLFYFHSTEYTNANISGNFDISHNQGYYIFSTRIMLTAHLFLSMSGDFDIYNNQYTLNEYGGGNFFVVTARDSSFSHINFGRSFVYDSFGEISKDSDENFVTEYTLTQFDVHNNDFGFFNTYTGYSSNTSTNYSNLDGIYNINGGDKAFETDYRGAFSYITFMQNFKLEGANFSSFNPISITSLSRDIEAYVLFQTGVNINIEGGIRLYFSTVGLVSIIIEQSSNIDITKGGFEFYTQSTSDRASMSIGGTLTIDSHDTPYLEGFKIRSQTNYYRGFSIRFEETSDVTVRNSNRSKGGGMYFYTGARPQNIYFAGKLLIENNQASDHGGGIAFISGRLGELSANFSAKSNTIIKNNHASKGGAVSVSTNGGPRDLSVIFNSTNFTVDNNTTSTGEGGILYTDIYVYTSNTNSRYYYGTNSSIAFIYAPIQTNQPGIDFYIDGRVSNTGKTETVILTEYRLTFIGVHPGTTGYVNLIIENEAPKITNTYPQFWGYAKGSVSSYSGSAYGSGSASKMVNNSEKFGIDNPISGEWNEDGIFTQH